MTSLIMMTRPALLAPSLLAQSDLDAFERFAQPQIVAASAQYNYCPECAIPMEQSCGEYQCSACGITQSNEIDGPKDHGETMAANIRSTIGANKGKFYNNAAVDYTKTQRKMIMIQLKQRQLQYTGVTKFPYNVLEATATQYNNIQKTVHENKKFVRRGGIKNEILAALLYFECVRAGLVRKKKDVAIFMDLATHGFSRGENILREMAVEQELDIPIDDDESTIGFTEKYMEALDMDEDRYAQFVVDLVEESERRRIGMCSQLSSKIVGAIWILICRCNLHISDLALERATDNTKKNTFIKFHNFVYGNIKLFAPIFVAHNIPIY